MMLHFNKMNFTCVNSKMISLGPKSSAEVSDPYYFPSCSIETAVYLQCPKNEEIQEIFEIGNSLNSLTNYCSFKKFISVLMLKNIKLKIWV